MKKYEHDEKIELFLSEYIQYINTCINSFSKGPYVADKCSPSPSHTYAWCIYALHKV